MRHRLNDVKRALSKPTEIHQNLEQRRVNMVYYQRCPSRDRVHDYLKVAVWVYDVEGKRAIVTTAHPVLDIPAPSRWYQGERRWPN